MPSRSKRFSLKQFLGLGTSAILLGFVSILFSIVLEKYFHPTSEPAIVTLSFLSHIGIALLVLGIVGIMVDLPDWQKYFQERIKETIIEKDYVHQLSQTELMNLVTNALKAYFKVDDIDEKESFLEYFQSRILGFIARPYREDTHGIIHIDYANEEDLFIVNDYTSYKCRKVGKNIQSDVSWFVEPGEIVGSIEEFDIELRMPENFFQSPEYSTRYPDIADGRLKISIEDPRLIKLDGGYKLSLEKYKQVDGLSITVSAKYKVRRDRFLDWYIVYPSKGLLFTIRYPKELELHRLVFGLNREIIEETKLEGLYTIRSDSWLLPNDGVIYQLLTS